MYYGLPIVYIRAQMECDIWDSSTMLECVYGILRKITMKITRTDDEFKICYRFL